MLEYQFKKNGVAIDGATSNTLSLVNIDENDNGNYTLTVTETTTGKSRKFGPLTVTIIEAVLFDNDSITFDNDSITFDQALV